ncbi:MAG: HlyC/CorC family transporter [Clostridia bacterium]|nr:HlyC/CorC family transporter [Clostridia bacterium]
MLDDDGSRLWLIAAVLSILFQVFFAAAKCAIQEINESRLKSLMEDDHPRAGLFRLLGRNVSRSSLFFGLWQLLFHILFAVSLYFSFHTSGWIFPVCLGAGLILGTLFNGLVVSYVRSCSEAFLTAFSPLLSFFYVVIYPVGILFDALRSMLVRAVPSAEDTEITQEELLEMLDTIADEGDMDKEKSELLHSAIEFSEIRVSDILTARVDVEGINVTDDPQTILNKIFTNKYSRMPVYEDNIDHIIGILQSRKYLKAYLTNRNPALRSLLDEPLFVHQYINADDLLHRMSEQRTHMCVVTDEFGGTLGVLTMEDILEELVGEIWDETDEVEEDFRSLPDGSYEADADLIVADALEKIGIDVEDLDEEDSLHHKTISAWALEFFELIPEEGQSFPFEGFDVVVSLVSNNRIQKVRFIPRAEEEKEADDE